MSPKDPSNDELLDEMRHQQIIEEEERIRREYPVLVARNKELEERVKDLERYKKSWDKELADARGAAGEALREVSLLRDKVAEQTEEIAELRARPQSVGRPLPVPQVPQRRQLSVFTPAVCRDCHQRILWGVTKNGRNIPLNTKPVVGEMVEWSRELEAQLLEKGIEMKRGYDELGDQVTVALVPDPNPLVARVVYPVHFQSCTARNLSSDGGSRTT